MPSRPLISPLIFWGLVLGLWILSQTPIIKIPINFLGTWVHEVGHGIGAEISGGTFEHMIISPDFSGRASTLISSTGSHVMVLLIGLLGPSIASFFILIMARGLGLSRLVLILLTLTLVSSALIWAGDMFTRITALSVGAVMGLLTWKTSPKLCNLIAQLIAISFAISAIASIDYFFMTGGYSGGRAAASDSATLAGLLKLPHKLLAILITLLSAGILFCAYIISDKLWDRKSARKEDAEPPVRLTALK